MQPAFNLDEGCLLLGDDSPINMLARAITNSHLEGRDICHSMPVVNNSYKRLRALSQNYAKVIVTWAGEHMATHCWREHERLCRVLIVENVVILPGNWTPVPNIASKLLANW